MQYLELLSPAKNLECGIATVNHGADAVYIGAPSFSARASVGNSLEDIATLVNYAHKFKVKVFVALNTVLTNTQILEAEKLITELYNIGVDALIIQDMGIMKLNIPPIAIHASTQADNRTVEKVKFLQDVGFSRAVLARELTLNQIKEISENTDIELECFVHGALCVSYSGQCYISEAQKGRSANRGECSQYCRLPYSLIDANDVELVKNKHLLSMKDLDLSEHLEELIDAGVTSLKIEGRMKDVDYVKNVTAYYRKKLDEIISKTPSTLKGEIRRASLGQTKFFFEPNPEKSFRRQAADYFFEGRKSGQVQLDTPKSMGEKLGVSINSGNNFIEISTEKELHNGDGLCFINSNGELQGFRVNTAERIGNKNSWKLYPNEKITIANKTEVYRNQDHEFNKILSGKTAERKIAVKIDFSETENGFSIQITDEEGISVSINFDAQKEPAKNTETAKQSIINQLSKLGNTIFEAENVSVNTTNDWFIPASQLNDWRRQAVELLEEKREKSYVRGVRREAKTDVQFPQQKLTYLGNVTNDKATDFYRQFGVDEILPGFEVQAPKDVPLMYCKYCIKHAMGWCPKEGYKASFKEPLTLQHNDEKFRLEFDCKKCEMRIY